MCAYELDTHIRVRAVDGKKKARGKKVTNEKNVMKKQRRSSTTEKNVY